MAITKPETKHGKDLEVGDVVIIGLRDSHTITGFDDHPGLIKNGKHHPARILRSGDYGITTFDDEYYRLTGSGAYISSHLWWHHEKKGR